MSQRVIFRKLNKFFLVWLYTGECILNTAQALIYTHIPFILMSFWIIYEAVSIRKMFKEIKKKVE